VMAQVLDRLIQERLIVQAAEADGMKVTENEVSPQVEQEMDAVRARFASDREFEAALRKEGLTREDMRRRVAESWQERYVLFKMVRRKQHDFETAADVGEAEIATYYAAHKADPEWQTQPMVHARHILFAVDGALTGPARKAALAEAGKKVAVARAALKRGEKFADVARALSEDGPTREAGGDLGTFGRGTYHENLEKAVFALKAGEVAGPVETPVGLHLLLAEEVLKPRPKTLDETVAAPVPASAAAGATPETQQVPLRDFIREQLKAQAQATALQSWIDGLKAKALIRKFEEEPPAK